MNIGNGIAIAGIWLGIGILSFKIADVDSLFAIVALGLLGTVIVACEQSLKINRR